MTPKSRLRVALGHHARAELLLVEQQTAKHAATPTKSTNLWILDEPPNGPRVSGE